MVTRSIILNQLKASVNGRIVLKVDGENGCGKPGSGADFIRRGLHADLRSGFFGYLCAVE